MAKNINLNHALQAKQDEFYTQIADIEREMKHYTQYFKDKVIFLNCDDPETSNFWRYFQINFYRLGLRKLISTHYDSTKPTYKMEIVGSMCGNQIGIPDYIRTPLKENGDFRSDECIEILKESDIVITNPPFSLFREYLSMLVNSGKQFIIMSRQTCITYKEVFTFIRDNKAWFGYNAGEMEFVVPSYYEPRETRYREENGIKYRSFGNMCWMTNIDIEKRHEKLLLYKSYNSDEYPFFDNYDAIIVNRVDSIPFDYDGVMGVPITFMYKHNPSQFEIVGLLAGNIKGLAGIPSKTGKDGPYYKGKLKFGRILIRRKDL